MKIYNIVTNKDGFLDSVESFVQIDDDDPDNLGHEDAVERFREIIKELYPNITEEELDVAVDYEEYSATMMGAGYQICLYATTPTNIQD